MRALVGELTGAVVVDVVLDATWLGLAGAAAAHASAIRLGVDAAMGLLLCGLVTGRSPSNCPTLQ